MSARTLTSLHVHLYRVPLTEELVDAEHGTHTAWELVTVTLVDSEGRQGTGYTYTGGRGGRAVWQLIDWDLREVIIGCEAGRISYTMDRLEKHVHYVGRGGVVSFALSAVDIALWDLELRRCGQSLWRAVGGFSSSCRCYRGGIDLGYTLPQLEESVRAYVRDGHTAVKIKVGLPSLEQDLERVGAVRELMGPQGTLMVDANMTWTPSQAVRAAQAFQQFDLLWLEEPTDPGNYSGYCKIQRDGGLVLAQGENLHTLEEFQHALAAGGVDVPQPDASNCGGITGWLKVAALAEAHGLEVSSHGMQELHVSLVAGVRNGGWLEVHSFPIDQYTMREVVVTAGRTEAPDIPGCGVQFNWQKLRPYLVLGTAS